MTIRLSPLEIASGLVLGDDPGVEPLPDPFPNLSPLGALEWAMLGALQRPPCLVGFSGGRDSSALLAVATSLARRDGYELPVPVTLRFPGDLEAEESGWQELVIAELGVSNWLRIETGDELGVLGQVARAALDRHGVLWPPNVHALVPLLEAAAGGSLVVGLGGDELFGGLPSRRLTFLPTRLRRAVAKRGGPAELSWLSPQARSALGAALAAEHAGEPIRWRRRVEWLAARRQLSTQRTSGEAPHSSSRSSTPGSSPPWYGMAAAADTAPVTRRWRPCLRG
jgi:asparagine synthetase B (glutamine-hydrolysing)